MKKLSHDEKLLLISQDIERIKEILYILKKRSVAGCLFAGSKTRIQRKADA
jgi:hypothetical protein